MTFGMKATSAVITTPVVNMRTPNCCRDEEDDLLDDRDLSDDENGNGGLQMVAMDGSEAFHQVVKDMLLNGHQVTSNAVPYLHWGVLCSSHRVSYVFFCAAVVVLGRLFCRCCCFRWLLVTVLLTAAVALTGRTTHSMIDIPGIALNCG